ncbi:MAG: hypothetical protein ACO3IV_07980, partial [Ilumatobacteraceae bacterium]
MDDEHGVIAALLEDDSPECAEDDQCNAEEELGTATARLHRRLVESALLFAHARPDQGVCRPFVHGGPVLSYGFDSFAGDEQLVSSPAMCE